ncbi:unnamed protein product [Bemisia tabaci]|nr:unnamed protein product [Bemisia tabaci]
MMKTYQLSNSGQYGASIKVVPVTTEDETNVESCMQVNGSDSYHITPQSVVPDLTNFKFIGQDIVDGTPVDKWRYVESDGHKVSKYTAWVRYERVNGSKTPIPVRYEMNGYNSLLGSHFDHYYLSYDSYTTESPDPDVFIIAENLKCGSFPGPGVDHIYTFNPIKEFIENYDEHVDNSFDAFKRKHNKSYSPSTHEHINRKEIFRQNLRFIHSKNRANLGFQMAVNHLADRSEMELKALRGRKYSAGYNGGLPFPYDAEKEIADVPETLDWRLFGAVTPVKDQSVCGSCWTFGTTGTVEGAFFLKYKYQVVLAPQALVDCSWGYGNNGCDGGEDYRAYKWIQKHGGLPTEEDYPYLGADGFCHVNNSRLFGGISGYVNVTVNDEKALKVALFKKGPISISIDASPRTFTFFSNGIYDDPDCKNGVDELDHSVLLVGYGSLNGKEYWLVKNSWSTYWGNDGYILISPVNNICGVTTAPTYVLMK